MKKIIIISLVLSSTLLLSGCWVSDFINEVKATKQSVSSSEENVRDGTGESLDTQKKIDNAIQKTIKGLDLNNPKQYVQAQGKIMEKRENSLENFMNGYEKMQSGETEEGYKDMGMGVALSMMVTYGLESLPPAPDGVPEEVRYTRGDAIRNSKEYTRDLNIVAEAMNNGEKMPLDNFRNTMVLDKEWERIKDTMQSFTGDKGKE